MASYLPILTFVCSLAGSAIGVYIGLRVSITRVEEQIKAMGTVVADHAERIKRLEGAYFKG